MLRASTRLAFSVASLATVTLAQTTERVSVSSAGVEANGLSGRQCISADGRFVVFNSSASNLVGGDTNGVGDVFVRDRLLGTTERISVSTSGAQADADCAFTLTMLSADGRYVVFLSAATTLVPMPPAGIHVYLRDRTANTTALVDVDTSGQVVAGSNGPATISADGRFVCFGGFNPSVGHRTYYIRDRTLHTTTTLFPGPCSQASNAPMMISQDGRYLAYDDCINGGSIVGAAMQDRQTLQTWGPSTFSNASSLSSDGRVMAFLGRVDWFRLGDSNDFDDVLVFDRVASGIELLSHSWNGEQTNGASLLPRVSFNGRFVSFISSATNLVPGDTNNTSDVFLTDRTTYATTLVSVAWNGALGNGGAGDSAVSDDGRFVAFSSDASNLVPNDNNGVADIFVRDVGFPAPRTYCVAKVNGQGCVPTIGWTGTPSLSGPDNFHVTATNMANFSPGLMFWSTGPDNVPFAGGTRCVGSPIIRTPIQFSGGTPYPAQDCSGTYDLHFSHTYMASFFLSVGSTVCAQYWQRDSTHVDGTGQGLSDGLSFTIAP